MKRHLIVNADDCNLTPGVTEAILDCHDSGILTSTTLMMNLPIEGRTVRSLMKRPQLGLGIHLNVTMGRPVSQISRVSSLTSGSLFRKRQEQQTVLPRWQELALEYQNQIELFRKIFKKKPTHLDTHHQMHDHPFFYEALYRVAQQNDLPIRRSVLMRQATTPMNVRTTDYLFGNLTVEGFWREAALHTLLTHLPEGTSEIMCHPGKDDDALRAVSSFTTGREMEWQLFSHPRFKAILKDSGVILSRFGMC